MNRRGQALVEAAPVILLFFGLLGALAVFTQWFLIHQKLLIAVREGAMEYSSGRLHPEEVQRHIRQYLNQKPLSLNNRRLDIKVGPWNGPQARLFQLDEIKVRYSPSGWMHRYFHNSLEEQCIIKHAPHYGPRFQTLYGPAVPW